MRVVGVSARRAVACTSGWSADAAVAAALLAAGADPAAKTAAGEMPWQFVPEGSPLAGTDAHRASTKPASNSPARAGESAMPAFLPAWRLSAR